MPLEKIGVIQQSAVKQTMNRKRKWRAARSARQEHISLAHQRKMWLKDAEIAALTQRLKSTTFTDRWVIDDVEKLMSEGVLQRSERHSAQHHSSEHRATMSQMGSVIADAKIEVQFVKGEVRVLVPPRLASAPNVVSVVLSDCCSGRGDRSLIPADDSRPVVITKKELQKRHLTASGRMTIVTTMRPHA